MGAGIGAFFAGSIANTIGRRGALQWASFVGFLVFGSTALSNGWVMFGIIRVLSGMVVGVQSVAVPMYMGTGTGR